MRSTLAGRDLLSIADLNTADLTSILNLAAAAKSGQRLGRPLDGKSIALIFQRPSNRTRVSFEAGIVELGGHPMVLRSDELQLTRGESIRDTAYVLSRHVAAIGIRTGPDELVAELATHATVPVINMLTAGHHPCRRSNRGRTATGSRRFAPAARLPATHPCCR